MSPRALLLVALLLAGCTAPAGYAPDDVERGCSVSATWREPGLFEALPDAAARAGFPLIDGMAESQGGIPFRHEDLDARGAPYNLTSLRWRPPEGPDVSLWPLRPGELEVSVHAGFDDPRLLPTFRAFLEALGLDASPERGAWERALERAPRDQWPPRVVLVGEPRVDPLYERLRPTLWEESNGPGGFQLLDTEWSLGFRVPDWHLVADELRLSVDARDHVYAHTLAPPGAPEWAALQAQTGDAFARMGLPPPTFEDARRQPSRAC